MVTAAQMFPCTPWCTEDDNHFGYALRGDQSCWGPKNKTVFSLDDYAPALGAEIPCDATGMTVYAYQGWYQLPKVRVNVFWEPNERVDKRHGIDHDFLLTPAEAIELANHLISAVETIGGAK